MRTSDARPPVKTREIATALFDSTRWNDFPFRDGDVVVSTWAKTGTTWTQQIVWQLLNGGPDGIFDGELCPWVDFRATAGEIILAGLEAQTGRRDLKTHLPVDGLVFSPLAKYLYIGRDARDVIWSAYNHQAGFTDGALAMLNTPGAPWPSLAHPAGDVRDYYLHWLETDDLPGWGMDGVSFWDHVQGWWDIRHLPNVLFVHFGALKADMAGEIARIARFLGIEVEAEAWPRILEHCGFDYMRREAETSERMKMVWKDGGKTFYNQGINGRWRDVLSPAEIARCDEIAAAKLTPDCARWLATGEPVG